MSTSNLDLFVILCLIVLRLLVALHPHSGQDNYHGSVTAYGGDYEAQRHWMELTIHLPLREWYTHDLQYWGLDYPPLTAYVSYICGIVSHFLVGPETVALYASRFGYLDTPTLLYTDSLTLPRQIQFTHKAFMRLTVLILDLAVFFTAVWACAQRLVITQQHPFNSPILFRFLLFVALAQPALILIDHGHFQYNSVCLGLSLWSFYYMTRKSDSLGYCVIASIFFSLALNFKQMTLYYAPAVFSYLLGRCLACRQKKLNHAVQSISILGLIVLLTFTILWYPFVYYRDTSTTSIIQTLQTILSRLFPFQRGMFEGKVANIWCSLSIRPFSIRSRIPTHYQPWAALGLTWILMSPFAILLFVLGRSWKIDTVNKHNNNNNNNKHFTTLLWGCTGTALAFFLASFQVHEKSILLAITPASLLIFEYPEFISWFSLVAMWSMWPLIHLDRLSIAYVACAVLFIVGILPIVGLEENQRRSLDVLGFLFGSYSRSCQRVLNVYYGLCCFIMILLHIVEVLYTPPVHMPDLFPMIWSISGCIMFCISWLISLLYCYQSLRQVMIINNHSKDGNKMD